MRKAFTLIELLIVIAIIGILIAMLMPAVNGAREAARRMKCVNNLKQIGLAVHHYESDRGHYPAGSYWIGGPTGHNGPILVHILPYIEQQALYDAFDFDAATTDSQTLPNGELITAQVISTYLCPSDNHSNTFDTPGHAASGVPNAVVALHNYAASAGPSAVGDNSGEGCSCASFGSFNAWATAPFSDGNNFAGAFTRMGTELKNADFRDGLSNTIFFGEVRPLCSWHNDNGWATSNNGNGYSHTLIPINYDTCSRESTGDGCNRFCNWNAETGFRSSHPGGAHFLLGDGSVHFFDQFIDMQLYQYLGDRRDGQVAQLPQ